MKGKWTLGEWRVGHNGMCVISDCDEGLHISGSTGLDAIEYYGGNLIAESVTKNNAHLISAAPDLYDALEYCIDCLGDEFALPVDCIDQAVSALRKARGE